MKRGEKLVTFEIEGRPFAYFQPGWWCSLDDDDDMEGQLVDNDNLVAEMARRTGKAIVKGEEVFVPVVIRAIRLTCGLTQKEAGEVFGTGGKSFEKYESGEIVPSRPTQRLLKLAMERPDLFKKQKFTLPAKADVELIHRTLSAASMDRIYGRLFGVPQ